jgi:tellurite resistance protein
MSSTPSLPVVPASFFGMVLGVVGLGFAWRQATRAWDLPAAVSEVLMGIAAAIWAVLMVLYVAKWIFARTAAQDEAHHPVQCCFVGLVGVATMLIAGAALPYSRTTTIVLFVAGATFTIVFAVWRTGAMWQGGRDVAASTPVLYLPTGAGLFVTAFVASALGWRDWGILAFGAGALSWLSIESVILHRLYTAPAMLAALRPVLGIQLAPPAVGAGAWLAVTDGVPSLLPQAMLGYALLQAAVLIRLLPWVGEQRLSAGYWAYSFGVTGLAAAAIAVARGGTSGAMSALAPFLFAGANIVVAVLLVGTVWLLLSGKLLPARVAAVNPAPVAGAHSPT